MSKTKKNCKHTFVYKDKTKHVGGREFRVKECIKCGTEKFEKVKK